MEKNISEWIIKSVDERTQEITEFLSRLIQIHSETGHEGEIQHFLAEYVQKAGLDVDVWEPDLDDLKKMPGYLPVSDLSFHGRPNVVGIYHGLGGGRSLILNGHVDTITIEPILDWHYGPLSGKLDQGKIYGRGASDMKGGVAAMTMALKILLDMGLRPLGNIFLEYVVDEELTGYGTLAAIGRGYKADAGICCETSDLKVQPACIGRLWFTIEIDGKPSSITTRWKSVSAIEKGIKIVQAVEDLERIRTLDLYHPLFPDNRSALPCAVCMFNAGTFPSATPDHALLRGSLGLMPFEDVQEVKRAFWDHIECVAKSDPWMRHHLPKVTFKDLGADGAEIPADHPIVSAVSDAFQQAASHPAEISGRTGGSDTRYLIKYGETPSVIFGPGVTEQMHAMNEFVPQENLILAVKTIALSIVDWCGI
jgi:acetylornithine deacetylase